MRRAAPPRVDVQKRAVRVADRLRHNRVEPFPVEIKLRVVHTVAKHERAGNLERDAIECAEDTSNEFAGRLAVEGAHHCLHAPISKRIQEARLRRPIASMRPVEDQYFNGDDLDERVPQDVVSGARGFNAVHVADVEVRAACKVAERQREPQLGRDDVGAASSTSATPRDAPMGVGAGDLREQRVELSERESVPAGVWGWGGGVVRREGEGEQQRAVPQEERRRTVLQTRRASRCCSLSESN